MPMCTVQCPDIGFLAVQLLKMLPKRQELPHSLPINQWFNNLLDIILMELSTAKITKFSPETVEAQEYAIVFIK